MKRYIIFLFTIFNFFIFAEEDNPSIILPKMDITIEDKKDLNLALDIKDIKIKDLTVDIVLRPDLTESIKIDLEKTLPQRVDNPEKSKPVDAIIVFGYGLNNNIYADFSIFIKNINPKISINYLRNSMETYWIDDINKKNSYSLDDLNTNLLFSHKNFTFGSELGYFAKSYSLQGKSNYSSLKKKILNIDLGPSIKFNFQNDLTLRVLNSFLFMNNEGKEDLLRNDFDYILNADLVYAQVFALSHFFSASLGYDFNYLSKNINKDYLDLKQADEKSFFNNIKASVSYSTMIKDSFLVKLNTNFLGMFRNSEFFWFIFPYAKLGYSYSDFFHCYVEGGTVEIKKTDRYWFQDNDFVSFPINVVSGYHWFVKTGIKASVLGRFSIFSDFEFAYNKDGNNFKRESYIENIYTLEKKEYKEIIVSAGFDFNYKQIVDIKIAYYFSPNNEYFFVNTFEPVHKISAEMKFSIPKTGLSFLLDFQSKINRFDSENNPMNHIFLLNATIDWNWQERFGVGSKFNNILYFQRHSVVADYEEPGFGFLVYLKFGF
ncbi:MAG TPA: hypothetical protein PLO89_00205 [Spirochaetota bacterium]|nr:hypothetical protein [Spirochaetota bacterium]